MAAGQVCRQLQPHREDLVAGAREVLQALPIGLLQDVPVQAGLGGGDQGVVLSTQPELEVAHVVSSQLYPDLDALVLLVYPRDGSPAKLASPLVVPGLWLVPGVPTHPTPPCVGLPLSGEAPAVTLVVVVVGRIVEAVPPHGGPGGWLYQSAVALAGPRLEERDDKYEEHLALLSVYTLSSLNLQSFSGRFLIIILSSSF